MTKNKTVLDRFFDHSAWVIKKFITFTIILTIIFLILYNSADPIWTTTYLDQSNTSVTFDLNQSGQTQFVIIPTHSKIESDFYTEVAISLFVNNGGNWTLLQTLPAERVVHILSLDKGFYRLEFENLGTISTNIEILIAQAEPTLLILFIGAVAAFAIFIASVQIIFPLYFIILVISLIKAPASEKQVVSPVTKLSKHKKKETFMGIPEEDVLQNDKIGFAIAGIMGLIGLIDNFFPLIFFAAMIFVGTYANAQNRFKLRKRFLNYANHPPFPHEFTLKEISFVLGEDTDKLEKLVLRMILDLGYPMEYDKNTGLVTVLENLNKPEVDTEVPPPTKQEETTKQQTGETRILKSDKFCVKCGANLPEGAIFCYNCGSKNT